MIFVVGGRYQGQREFAEGLNAEGEKEIVCDYHLRIREQMEKGLDPVSEAKKFYEESPEAIVCSDEVGMGIVPVDAFEREYREVVGRVHIWLAGASDEVYRVICGIGQRIK